MKSRSITGPVLLVVVGLLFLVNNLRPDVPMWSLVWDYWPVLLMILGVIGLVEALFNASRGVPNPPRPLSGGGVIWIVALIAFCSWASSTGHLHLGPFANGGIHLLGAEYDYDVSETGTSTGVTRVVLDNLHGTLSVKGEDGGDVKVSGRKSIRAFSKTDADRADRQSPIQVERQGDLLIIRAQDPKDSNMLSVSCDLDITIPRGLDVEASGRSGDLTIDDISGNVNVTPGRGDVRLSNIGKDVRIEDTRGGLIRVTDVKGKLDLTGRGGDVQIENVGGQVTVHGEYLGTLEFHALAKQLHFTSESSDFRVEAVPGNITLDSGDLKMTDVTGPVRFKTGTRDIETMDVTNGMEISIQRGDIEVTQTKTPLPKLDVHTHSGDVTLAIPENSEFDLDGKTGRGDATNDFGEPLKMSEEGRAATIQGKKGNGPEIKVGTDRGSLTIKKS
jgi:DUF4097 and DUF4098 domain-containing protein YvlB